MTTEINKVAVIGAGVMGAGIAAHVANAGIPVVLLDIVPKDAPANKRSAIAEGAVAKMLKADPAPFMHKRNAKLITTGNLEDNLDLISDCDWVIEAIIENLAIKQDLYRKLESVRKPGSMLSSNTSTIPMNDLMDGMADEFAKNFMITHFFNPPRYMRLLEIAYGDQTDMDAVSVVRDFSDKKLGKGVVVCKDTPGFIANRIGIYWIQVAVQEAFNMGLTVEEADAVVGRPMGIPKTGVFALSDLVGLDLLPHLMESMERTLPASDPMMQRLEIPELITNMIADGYTGRKGKGGFYRLNRAGGKKVKESVDLQTGEYAPSTKARLASIKASRKGGLQALVSHEDKGGQYAWSVLSQVLSY
ncbi:MAG: 3-hydroxyacyl-CoA dehydrogenase family protein, partial [Thiolinea sp.]